MHNTYIYKRECNLRYFIFIETSYGMMYLGEDFYVYLSSELVMRD